MLGMDVGCSRSTCSVLTVLVQLLHFQPDVVRGGFNLGMPVLDRHRHLLQHGDTGTLGVLKIRQLVLPLLIMVGEALVPLEVILVEALLD